MIITYKKTDSYFINSSTSQKILCIKYKTHAPQIKCLKQIRVTY